MIGTKPPLSPYACIVRTGTKLRLLYGFCDTIKGGEFVAGLRHCQLPKMDSAQWHELVLCCEKDRAASSNVLSSDITNCCVSV